VPFGQLAHIERGKFTARPRNNPRLYGGNIPFIQTGDVTNSNGKITTYSQTLNEEGLKVSKRFPRGTLFFTIAANIGDVGVASFETACPDSLVAITPAKRTCQDWLAHELRRRKQSFENLASHNAQLNINLEKLRPYLLCAPPFPEQEAIAEALSDADALIESLEHLLSKKRQVKQGAMQELLTGKKRLAGFSGEWEVKRLGEVGEVSGSGVDKKVSPDELPVRLVNYLDVYRRDFIYSENLDHWVSARPEKMRRCAVQKGDVFFTPSSETRDDIGISAVAMEDIPDAAYSYHVVRLRLFQNWDLRFRAYAFKTKAFFDQAETLCDGSGTRYVISLDKFRSIMVSVPSIEEQTAIATVLSDMDAEIEIIEAKLAKSRQIKQGMMQELLTGKTRLI